MCYDVFDMFVVGVVGAGAALVASVHFHTLGVCVVSVLVPSLLS